MIAIISFYELQIVQCIITPPATNGDTVNDKRELLVMFGFIREESEKLT